MAKVLSRILTKESGGKKDTKKKKKKKRKRMKNGVIVSSTGSSSASSPTEEEEEDSDSDLEAPMRKRSRDKPGSVLALLTEHVREQMDQSSLADVPSGGQVLTGGVKIASYFAIHIKGQFPQCQRELREMFSLAATMDLLRKGDVARVGDSLAARFYGAAPVNAGPELVHGETHGVTLHGRCQRSHVGFGIGVTQAFETGGEGTRKRRWLVQKRQGERTRRLAKLWGWCRKPEGRKRGKMGRKAKERAAEGGGQGWDAKVNEWEKKKETPAEK